MIDDFLQHFVQFLEDLDRVVTVNSGDEVGTLANIHLILVAPLDPSMVRVDRFHRSTSSVAEALRVIAVDASGGCDTCPLCLIGTAIQVMRALFFVTSDLAGCSDL
jgi:hypothetical protein